MIDPQRKPHHHAALIKAWADGAEIEFLTSNGWVPCPSPLWIAIYQYRVKPTPHKWQKEMDAAREDKTIQWRFSTTDWKDWPAAKEAFRSMVGWDDAAYEFRIKPEPEILTCQINLIPHRNLNLIYGGRQTDNLELTFEEGKLIAAKVLS